MDLAYRYIATNARSQEVRGVVYAPDIDLAYARIKQGALRARRVEWSPRATLDRWMSGGKMPAKELVRFYRVLARRYRSGRPVIDTLENASSFVRDDGLLQGAVMMAQRMLDGAPIHEAMRASGFPRIHAMSIRAAEGSGNMAEAFTRLADEIEREARVSKGVAAAMRTPKILAGIMYVAVILALYFLAPMPEEFMKELGKKPGAMHEAYFAASHALRADPLLWGGLYLAWPVGLIAAGRRWGWGRLADAWPSWREMSERADHGSCWTAFGLLYQAGIPPFECASVVAEAAKRMDTQAAFTRLAGLLTAGQTIALSVSRSGFPQFVNAGVAAAEESGGSLSTALQEFAHELAEDVEEITAIVQGQIQFASVVLGALMLLAFAWLTLFPIMSAAVPG